ncbi:unnamed protein product [Linum trigynum]|uniref:RBR-type E3 ubiquitin transferase n=1 Tax=Linum trigynum TaxID=586398 RepID=A0AAV2FY82_9ROSI
MNFGGGGGGGDDHHYLHSLFSVHYRDFMAAEPLDSDLEFAYDLQLQEAIKASLSLAPSTSSSPPPLRGAAVLFPETIGATPSVSAPKLQFDELARLEQEMNDRRQSEIEARRMREALNRRVHDQEVAHEMLGIPEDDWPDWGDEFDRPFGEGSSKTTAAASSLRRGGGVFRLYFKGLVSEERVNGQTVLLAGIGVAICDPLENLVFEVRKPLIGERSKGAAEIKALIEGLNAALALDLQRIVVFYDYYPLYQFVTGRWPPKQRKVAMSVNQVSCLYSQFESCDSSLIPRYAIRLAFKLARDAIVSQISGGPSDSVHGKTLPHETCDICFEDTDVDKMFSVDQCSHRFCFSCMKQHVEVKLLHGMVPQCPSDGCKSELKVDSCQKFLTPKLIETMQLRIKEASIPATEKVYCPYPKCSALMSKSEAYAFVGSERTPARKCLKCHGLFCIDCKVPWHSAMNCDMYRRVNPNPPEDAKLKFLASSNLWRQCKKCSHMIELAEGCYHMTCRCGNEFCYNCGAEWKDKKATCSCPLWIEDNILYNDELGFSDEEEPEFDHDWDSDLDYFL